MIPRDHWSALGGPCDARIVCYARAIDRHMRIVATWYFDDHGHKVDIVQHFGARRAISVQIEHTAADVSYAAAAYEAACIIIDDPATARDAAVQWLVEVHPQHPTPDTMHKEAT